MGAYPRVGGLSRGASHNVVAVAASILDLLAAVSSSLSPEPPMLQLDLPDPERDDISTMEFLAQLEQAWAVCDRFDLQTEILRGRILKAVRDREKRGGEGRGAGFLQWLREREISKTRAYSLIQLAESAEDLVGGGLLEEAASIFLQAGCWRRPRLIPVQLMISEAANGRRSPQKVRRLTDEFTMTTNRCCRKRSGSALRKTLKSWHRW